MSWLGDNIGQILPFGSNIITTVLQGLLPNFRGQNDYQHYIDANQKSDERLLAVLGAMNKSNENKPNNTIFYIIIVGLFVLLLVLFLRKGKK